MRILFEHSDYFAYALRGTRKNTKNCLVLRVCFEKGDEAKMGEIENEIVKVHSNIKPECLVLFPYAHLSNNLPDFKTSEKLFGRLSGSLEKKGIKVLAVPFGIDKGYEIKVKEHALNCMYRGF